MVANDLTVGQDCPPIKIVNQADRKLVDISGTYPPKNPINGESEIGLIDNVSGSGIYASGTCSQSEGGTQYGWCYNPRSGEFFASTNPQFTTAATAPVKQASADDSASGPGAGSSTSAQRADLETAVAPLSLAEEQRLLASQNLSSSSAAATASSSSDDSPSSSADARGSVSSLLRADCKVVSVNGASGSNLSLTTMGGIYDEAGKRIYTVWRIRNPTAEALSVTLRIGVETIIASLTAPANSDNYVRSPAESAGPHSLVDGLSGVLISTKVASNATFRVVTSGTCVQ